MILALGVRSSPVLISVMESGAPIGGDSAIC